MTKEDMKVLHDCFRALYNSELALADFYRACGEKWENELSFWWKMASEEAQHAANLIKMAQIISEKPWHFEMGEPVDPNLVRRFTYRVNSKMKLLEEDKIKRSEILCLARELENSLIEFEHQNIVNSGDKNYQKLLGQMVMETKNHEKNLERKILSEPYRCAS